MESQLHFVNTLNCPLTMEISGVHNSTNFEARKVDIDAFGGTILSKIPVQEYKGKVTIDSEKCKDFKGKTLEFKAESEKEKAYSYIIESMGSGVLRVRRDVTEEELEKSKEGNPKLKLILSGLKEELDLNATLFLEGEKGHKEYLNLRLNESKTFVTDPQKYKLTVIIPANETANRSQRFINVTSDLDPLLGGNYLLILKKDEGDNSLSSMSFTVTEPNSVHMLWLLPQYIVITIAEVMFSVTGLEFSFAQAPGSMKAVIQAAWLLTVAFGNLIVVFITEFVKLGSQSKEFFLFAGLMFVDMIVFAIMAYFYKPAKPCVDKHDDDDHQGFSDIALETRKKENVD